MPKYNIFKIPVHSKDSCIDFLLSDKVGLERIFEEEIDGYQVDFLFSKRPEEVDIWWLDLYQDFFANTNLPKNKVYFAALILSKSDSCYAISLGKTHFYLRRFCDPDFGLNMAERIADLSNPKSKNSQFFQSKRSKEIITYKSGYDLDYDSGESLHFLRSETLDSKLWGRIASFGHSLQISIKSPPRKLPQVIKRIDLELLSPSKTSIPKTEIVKDRDQIERLNRTLCEAILDQSSKDSIQIDEFSVSGVDFVFNDHYTYGLYLKGEFDDTKPDGDLSIAKLLKFVSEKGLSLKEEIDNIFVKVFSDTTRPRGAPIKSFLDFVEEKESCALIDGKWHHFNNQYLAFIDRDVDLLTISSDSIFDLPKQITEDDFNKSCEKDHGYINLDKNFEILKGGHKVEKMDLFKERTLHFVKIGLPQKLNYVIDQSINTVRLLQNGAIKIRIDGKRKKIDEICLWLIIPRKRSIQKISEFKSIIFKMKLVEWRRTVLLAGMKPLVKINYIHRPGA